MFDDKPVIMRTSAGVQGALLALEAAERVLLTGFLTAKATAEVLRSMGPKTVTLVAMGWNMEHPAPEDEWCALYLAHLLGRGHFDPAEALSEILAHQSSRKFFDPELSHLPAEDPAVCLQRDWFDFALEAARDGDLVRITPLRA
jgi:phosphosulfolactate phosphohydrolase-like enzyme